MADLLQALAGIGWPAALVIVAALAALAYVVGEWLKFLRS